jgi:hypothetical protein
MSKLDLDRMTLASFLPNHQAIVAFERVLNDVGSGLPSTIEEANALAGQALAAAAQALSMLAEVAGALEQMTAVPRAELGTISPQNADAVEITGGTIGLDAGTVAAPSFYLAGDKTTGLYRIATNNWGLSIAGVKLADYSATAAAYTQNVSTTKQLVSTVATGTAPLVVDSTTLVANLYVARAALADDATHATNADNATTANALTSPTSYPADATDLPTVITLANALKAAAISKGL